MATLVLWNAAVSTCLAVPSLTLSSIPSDLSNVVPGSMLTLSVRLSDLDAGTELDSLAATVEFDSLLLGEPAVSKGQIVPDPLHDPLDFLSLVEPGTVDAAFSTLSADPAHHITENGTFYSFTVRAVGPGTGSISLDFADGTIFNLADPASPIPLEISAGPAVPFAIVPEPGSAVLGAIALLLVAWWNRTTCVPQAMSSLSKVHASARAFGRHVPEAAVMKGVIYVPSQPRPLPEGLGAPPQTAIRILGPSQMHIAAGNGASWG
jgi:hypothetical protein